MKSIKAALSVSAETFREAVRNKFFAIFAVFAVCAIYLSLLAGVMAVDEEYRVLTDLGLGLMELMVLAYALFHAATAVTREAETKTIYLVLSRPVPRGAYVAGKTMGLYALSAFMLIIMALIHISLLGMRGFAPEPVYAAALACIWLKMLIIISVAVFVSMFSTSSVSTIVIAGILWTLGHFTPEARFMMEKTEGILSMTLRVFSWLIPDLQLYNLRDGLSAPKPEAFRLFWYAALWMAGCAGGSLFLFRKKEF